MLIISMFNPDIRALVLSVCILAGCSGADQTGGAKTNGIGGSLAVFAASSLKQPFDAIDADLAASNTNSRITFSFAGSNALVTQILEGAPADVVALADQANMNRLVDAGLVEPPVTFARNTLEIAVAPKNPKRITGLRDLERSDVSLVMAADGVPVGEYGRQVLSNMHETVKPKSLETDVKSTLVKVIAGEVDAAIVYATDVAAAGTAVTGVEIPAQQQAGVDISYPMAIVKASKNHVAAQTFVQSAVSGEVHKQLAAAGFQDP
jgi:molybdate transport system substrate-binding protein